MVQRLVALFRWSLLLLAVATPGFLRAENRILIAVKINDQPVRFAFDTGAGDAILWRSSAEKLGLKVTPPPPDTKIKFGEVPLNRTEPVKLEVLGHLIPSAKLAVIENPPVPTDDDGVIGWPNLRNNPWAFQGATLHFEPFAVLPPKTASWLKLRERTDWNILALELPKTGSGPPNYLGIDTGNPDGVFLAPPAWSKWRALNAGQPATLMAYFMPGAGLVVTEVIWAQEINLQGLKLRGVPVSLMNPAEVALMPPDTLAVIGLAALRRMDMFMDGKGDVYIQTADTAPPAYTHNHLGAVFMPGGVDQNELVAQVIKNGPAGKAGLRDGDILLKIDELDVTPWRTQPGILPLSRFWQQPPGTKLRLTLQRGAKKITATIVLRNILGPVGK